MLDERQDQDGSHNDENHSDVQTDPEHHAVTKTIKTCHHLSSSSYRDKIQELSLPARLVAYMFEADLPPEEIIEILGWRHYHANGRTTFLTDSERVAAKVEFMHLVHEIRSVMSTMDETGPEHG